MRLAKGRGQRSLRLSQTTGSRFSPENWGAWYCSFAVETALQEVAYHLTRALAAVGEYDNVTPYVELFADFDAEFLDLRGQEPVPSCLHPDTATGYPAGQQLAIKARTANLNGIVYPSVRDAGGTCLVAFWPGLVQNFQRGETWELIWQGEPTPEIKKAVL